MSDSLIVGGEAVGGDDGEGVFGGGGGGEIVKISGDPVPDPIPAPIPDPRKIFKTSEINTPLDRVEC